MAPRTAMALPSQYRVGATLILVLAGLFYLMFGASKQIAYLSSVNAFAEDPYDAVGSFGIQVAVIAALLSMVRAFRPYQPGQAAAGATALLLRAETVSVLPIAITLVSDAIAMARSSATWVGTRPGLLLAAAVAGLALLAAVAGWLLRQAWRDTVQAPPQGSRSRAAAVCLASVCVLALYPMGVRQSMPGAIITALVGMAVLFAATWALVTAAFPGTQPELDVDHDDLVDDLGSIYCWLTARWRLLAVAGSVPQWLLRRPPVRAALGWLSPRRHTWNGIIAFGVLMGLLLALAQLVGEGAPVDSGRLALVGAVFVGLEGLGVILGYVLLATPLRLFRQEPDRDQLAG